jgi:hypothetical protein
MDMTRATVALWRDQGFIKMNSYGCTLWLPTKGAVVTPGAVDYGFRMREDFRIEHSAGKHRGDWYVDNANGKMVICNATGMDSGDAIHAFPGLVAGLDGAFPWKGGVIDLTVGIGFATSGGTADEDQLISETAISYAKLLVDARGTGVLQDARARGEDTAEDPWDRMTRVAS